MNKLTGFVIFIAGAAIGSSTTWYYTKKYYEKIAQEEIDDVKAKFSYKVPSEEPKEKKEDSQDQKAVADIAREKPSVAEYAKKLSKEGYTNYSNSEGEKTKEKYFGDSESKPYVISPDEFRSDEDYDVISLTYYADHILADENDEIVEDVEDSVGFESLTHFGEYEDDSVFVRNDRLKVEYEILRDQRTYSEIIKTKPYLVEG